MVPVAGVGFDEYVAARGQALLRFAHVLTGDAHLAEDLTQTALAQAYRHWRRVAAADHPDAYVRRVLVNAHLSRRRRRSSSEVPTEDPAEVRTGAAAPDHADAVATDDQARRLLAGLAPRARTVLALRYYDDLDDAAIAELMGVTVSSVRATASRALAALRTQRATDTATVKETR